VARCRPGSYGDWTGLSRFRQQQQSFVCLLEPYIARLRWMKKVTRISSRLRVRRICWTKASQKIESRLRLRHTTRLGTHIDEAPSRRLGRLAPIAIVTSAFHMPRSRAIFEWIFGLEPGKYSLHFEATQDEGLDGRLLARRIEKEAAALKSLRALAKQIRDLPALHRWFHTEHNAYTARGWIARRMSPPEIAELY